MNACYARPTHPAAASLDAAFLQSAEAAGLINDDDVEFAGVPSVRFRMLAWPAHLTNLLRATDGVSAEDVSVATLGRVLFEDLRALRRRDTTLAVELHEELVAFYAFLARVRPASNAAVVLAWLRRPVTGRRLHRALCR